MVSLIIASIVLWFVLAFLHVIMFGLVGRERGYGFLTGIRQALRTRKRRIVLIVTSTVGALGFFLIVHYLG